MAPGGSPFTVEVMRIVRAIPPGRVGTYGQIASYAGNARAARQVSWILHACSRSHGLPWHRVINSRGTISLRPGGGYELQKTMLRSEGVVFGPSDRIDLRRFGFRL